MSQLSQEEVVYFNFCFPNLKSSFVRAATRNLIAFLHIPARTQTVGFKREEVTSPETEKGLAPFDC